MVKISVIIPALNEEKYIKYPLQGLAKQSFRDFETIVVDGKSTDRTRVIARRRAKVVVREPKGMGVARNEGARIAKGDILVFLDADTMPSSHLLMDYSKAFSDGTIAATGPILPLEKSKLRVELGYRFVSEVFVKATIAIGVPSIVGSNFAIKRKAFNKIGGFDARLKTYEDWDLSERVRKLGRIKFIDDARVYASTRRVTAWGVGGYFGYHVGNMVRYRFFKKPKEVYAPIR